MWAPVIRIRNQTTSPFTAESLMVNRRFENAFRVHALEARRPAGPGREAASGATPASRLRNSGCAMRPASSASPVSRTVTMRHRGIASRTYDSPRRSTAAAETPEAILGAALRLFETQGYAATGMSEVATEAGISLNTIHVSVGKKPQLLLALFRDASEDADIEATLATIGAVGSPRELINALAGGTRVVFERYDWASAPSSTTPRRATRSPRPSTRRRRATATVSGATPPPSGSRPPRSPPRASGRASGRTRR